MEYNQSKINLDSPIKNGKGTELLECKVNEKYLCLLISAIFWSQEASDHHGSLKIFYQHSMHYRSV